MIYTLVYIHFQICCSWSMFHSQLIFLREIFQKNGCLKNFIDKCFKVFLNRSHKKRFLPLKRTFCNQLFLIQKHYRCTLGLNCKSKSKVHLGIVNYSLFSKVKINSLIIFALRILFAKFLHQMEDQFARFSDDYAMYHISENKLDIFL